MVAPCASLDMPLRPSLPLKFTIAFVQHNIHETYLITIARTNHCNRIIARHFALPTLIVRALYNYTLLNRNQNTIAEII